jgi:hypothetical protein
MSERGADQRPGRQLVVNTAVAAAVAVVVSVLVHGWWYGRVVAELQRACDPYAKEFGVAQAADPKTITEVLAPYARIFEPLRPE